MFLKKIDPFVFLIIGSVIAAMVFPSQGHITDVLKIVADVGIWLLFFINGVKLSREVIFSAVTHWRMHVLVFSLTFILFPIMGLFLKILPETILKSELYLGVLFLCVLPSTVQSSVIFTSMAGGNVAGAICSASISTLLGVFVSPFLIQVLANFQATGVEINFFTSIKAIVLQVLLPFLLGNIFRNYFLNFVQNTKRLKWIDQFSIALVVYLAFSKAVTEGFLQFFSFSDVVLIVLISLFLLLISIFSAIFLCRKLKFLQEDEITVVFCGSKKSLVNGVPMATILFKPTQVGVVIFPLLIFHQIQLFLCTFIAQWYLKKRN